MALKRIPYDLVARHAMNEHGSLSAREQRCNELAMQTVGEIMSRFRVDPTDLDQGNVLVITRASWGETLVKLENEE